MRGDGDRRPLEPRKQRFCSDRPGPGQLQPGHHRSRPDGAHRAADLPGLPVGRPGRARGPPVVLDPDRGHSFNDVLPGWFQTYVGLEEAAALIRTYEVQF
ncbi:hypothetical protein ABZ885_33485, partial [Kitasatospora sp. NPDC047058]